MDMVKTRIKEERININYSQTELAKKLAVAPQTVNGWENGRRIPDPQTLSSLADIFNCSVDYLLGRTDNKNSSIIEDVIDNKNVLVEIDKDFFKTLTPADVQKFLKELQDVGFDLKKLL